MTELPEIEVLPAVAVPLVDGMDEFPDRLRKPDEPPASDDTAKPLVSAEVTDETLLPDVVEELLVTVEVIEDICAFEESTVKDSDDEIMVSVTVGSMVPDSVDAALDISVPDVDAS